MAGPFSQRGTGDETFDDEMTATAGQLLSHCFHSRPHLYSSLLLPGLIGHLSFPHALGWHAHLTLAARPPSCIPTHLHPAHPCTHIHASPLHRMYDLKHIRNPSRSTLRCRCAVCSSTTSHIRHQERSPPHGRGAGPLSRCSCACSRAAAAAAAASSAERNVPRCVAYPFKRVRIAGCDRGYGRLGYIIHGQVGLWELSPHHTDQSVCRQRQWLPT
ncbi:hypothetical protein IWZ01DRAFT_490307 [Phyllosticta capitalensis]